MLQLAQWLGLSAALIAWGFALYVFIVAPRTRGARYLVALLVLDGLAVITSYVMPEFINAHLHSLGLPAIPGPVHQMSDWAIIVVYLPFLGITLSSPLVKPLKNPIIANTILYGGLAFALSIPLFSESFRELIRVPFYIIMCAVLTWGFVAALHSWALADNDAERERARAFSLAFGVRDLLWTLTFSVTVLLVYGVLGDGLKSAITDQWFIGVAVFYSLAVILYVPLVAYGVLRLQLFDVDLRIKRTIKRSTIAAFFVAAFFVISELTSEFLSNEIGAVLGVICTGVLLLFLNPIRRVAEKLTDAAMPNTRDTPEYQTFRKHQVYQSAVYAALEDGEISERQRRVLNSMIDSLGIDPRVAEVMEADACSSPQV